MPVSVILLQIAAYLIHKMSSFNSNHVFENQLKFYIYLNSIVISLSAATDELCFIGDLCLRSVPVVSLIVIYTPVKLFCPWNNSYIGKWKQMN